MLKESAIVVGYQSGIAQVKCQSQSACGQCIAKTNCGTAALSELNGQRGEYVFNVETLIPLRIGQVVEIGLEENIMLYSALLMYVVPLFTLLGATLLSSYISENEPIRALFIIFCTAFSFWLIKHYSQKLNLKTHFKPVLLRVLTSDS